MEEGRGDAGTQGRGDEGDEEYQEDEGTKGQLVTTRFPIVFSPRVSVSPRPRVLFPMPHAPCPFTFGQWGDKELRDDRCKLGWDGKSGFLLAVLSSGLANRQRGRSQILV